MNRALVLAAVVFLASQSTLAFGGPYSIENYHVVRIDPRFQTATPIGNGPHNVTAIEFSQDGSIYGVNHSLDTLVRIDPATGMTETIGPLGIDLDWGSDLDEDSQGQLWMLEEATGALYNIDRFTGAAELHCQADDDGIFGLVSIDGTTYTNSWLPITTQNPGCGLEYLGGLSKHLEHGPDGWIHGLYFQWVTWHWGYNVFYRHHPTSGETEVLGRFIDDFGGGMWGLTFDPTEQPPAPAIPALNRNGSLVLLLMLIATGVMVLARTR